MNLISLKKFLDSWIESEIELTLKNLLNSKSNILSKKPLCTIPHIRLKTKSVVKQTSTDSKMTLLAKL